MWGDLESCEPLFRAYELYKDTELTDGHQKRPTLAEPQDPRRMVWGCSAQ